MTTLFVVIAALVIETSPQGEAQIQVSELLAAFELNQESLERYDVLVESKRVSLDEEDKLNEEESHQRIRFDLQNDRLLSVMLGNANRNGQTGRYGNCLIANGEAIHHEINLFKNKSIPSRQPSSLKYCFLTQLVPEFRTIGLADFPNSIEYGEPDKWREEFNVYKTNQRARLNVTSNDRAELSFLLENPRFFYVLTFDLSRNLIVHRKMYQLVRSVKDAGKLKKLLMFEEAIRWKEASGVFVPTKLIYTSLTPAGGKKMNSIQKEVTLQWIAVNEEFESEAFDVSAGQSFEKLQQLVTLDHSNTIEQESEED